MNSWNLALFDVIHSLSGRFVFLDAIAIFFAQYLAYFLVLGFFALLFFQKGARNRFYHFCETALAIILARGIVTEVIRFFYDHPRPFDALGFSPLIPESGPSFPSGHATFFFALAMAVWYADRKWGMWYFICAIFIGIARIYSGVHWPLDVLGGAMIGVACAMFIHWLFRNVRTELAVPKRQE
jgi:undecaprenyl-diphosphatase